MTLKPDYAVKPWLRHKQRRLQPPWVWPALGWLGIICALVALELLT